MWDAQLPALEGRRIVTVEHPGHGGAPVVPVADVASLAARVIAAVGEGSFSFVGLSLGGAVGLQIALDAPERLERLVVACAAARFGEPQQWHDRAATVRREGLASIADAVIGRWFTPAFRDTDPWRAMLLSVDPEGYARCCEALAHWDVRDDLAAISVPTLVVSGRDDPSYPPEHGKLLAERIPEARLVVIDDAAHLANVERPEAFNQLLKEAL
jgi:3-oxoadipate enol-lactonase